jgi:sodium-dependent dicarboxylate transporter 2/3/5
MSKLEQKGAVSAQESSFDRKRHIFGAIAGPIVALLVYLMPIAGLADNPAAHKLLAIVTFVAFWWICEPVPIPVTSLIGPTLCVILGVVNATDAFKAFANPMIFLFMGGFLIAKGMMVNGLDKRIAYGIMSMKWVGDSPRRIFLAIGLACMLCSGWISNTATAAMMFPIALGLLEAIREMMAVNGKEIDLRSYKYATGLMLMTAYACSIGGVLTPIGTPPNIIMIGFIRELAPDAPQITFFNWMIWGFLAMILYFIVTYFVLQKMFPADVKHIDGAQEFIQEHKRGLGKWTRAQKNTLIAFIVAVVLWVTPGILSAIQNINPNAINPEFVKNYNAHFPEAIAAMVGGLLLFLMPVDLKKGEMTLSWKDGVKGIDWGTLLLFGGGLAIGGMVFSTGLSQWIGESLTSALGGHPSEYLFLTLFAITSLLLSELTSNTAVANLMGPIAIATAVSLGFSPVPVCVCMALCTSLAFMLPVSTPPNAITYSSGYIPITKMIKAGILLDIIGVFAITVPLVYFVVKAIMGV